MSVAAVDSALVVADFSQKNSAVEIAAPGVTVRSTVPMGTGFNESATVGTTGYEVVAMELSANGTGSGALVDCGIAGGAGFSCPGASGKVCLIERGTFSFEEKTNACAAGGGVAAIIFNNAAGLFSGTLGVAGSIPSVSMSQADGLYLRANKAGASSRPWPPTTTSSPAPAPAVVAVVPPARLRVPVARPAAIAARAPAKASPAKKPATDSRWASLDASGSPPTSRPKKALGSPRAFFLGHDLAAKGSLVLVAK